MAKQQEFDWTWAQRREWINEAQIPTSVARDGKPVSASAMAGVLNVINDHLGNNAESWPGQATIAERLKISERTVRRAAEGLAALSLLIYDARPSAGGTRNFYRIVWTELQLLQPARRAAWQAMLRGELPPEIPTPADARPPDTTARPPDTTARPPDTTARPPDTTARPPDTTARPPDTVSAEYYKNTKRTLTTTQAANERSAEPHTAPQAGVVVASEIFGVGQGKSPTAADDAASSSADTQPQSPRTWSALEAACRSAGMSDDGARGAIAMARRRDLSPSDAAALLERYLELSATDPRVNVGWLHRWLTGRSAPPRDPVPQTLALASGLDGHAERKRADLIAYGRRQGWTFAQLQTAVRRFELERLGMVGQTSRG